MQIRQRKQLRIRRHRRVRAKVIGTGERPRLCVFRSNRHLELQLIDDNTKKTIVAARDYEIMQGKKKSAKISRGEALGEFLANKAKEKGVLCAVFDRGGYAYHGIVKAVACGARKGGLEF